MREEQKLNKAIRQDGIDTQADILEELKRKFPQYVEPPKSDDTVKRKRIAVFSSLAAVAACAAIIIPCAIFLPNNKVDDSGKNRYNIYNEDDYSQVVCDYTLREYSESTEGKILYFDWYNTADEYITYNYKSQADGQVLAVEEYAYFDDVAETIYLVVTQANVYFELNNLNVNKYSNKQTIDGHTVKWWISDDDALCMFEENGYRYFIRVEEGQDETRLFELAGELLKKN